MFKNIYFTAKQLNFGSLTDKLAQLKHQLSFSQSTNTSCSKFVSLCLCLLFAAQGTFAQSSLTNVNGILFYTIENQLWRSDGTSQGTYKVKDIPKTVSDPLKSSPSNLINVNGTLYFAANVKDFASYETGTNSYELWKSNGTAAGTVKIKDMPYGKTDGQFPILPLKLINANGVLFFTANNSPFTYDLWKSDGTAAGTVPVKTEIRAFYTSYEHLYDLASAGNLVFFTNKITASNNDELWRTDGTQAGTFKITGAISSGQEDTRIFRFTNVNGILYFVAYDQVHGFELWKSNGTSAGTMLVKDATPGYEYNTVPLSSDPAHLTNVNGTLYFTIRADLEGGAGARELWKSDGSAAGTIKLISLVEPEQLTNVNGTLYFVAGYRNKDLWKSNGTTSGTVVAAGISTAQSSFSGLTNVNGTLFFVYQQISGDAELWKSNGTEATTMLVKDIYPGSSTSGLNSSNPANLTAVGTQLFFTAFDGATRDLWKSNGTAAGTVKVIPGTPAVTCTATGSISREYWANVSGITVAQIPLSASPTSRSTLTSFETATNIGDNYGQRIRGYVCAPNTGSYTFYLASDDSGELWLSTDENPANKRKIASVNSVWTAPRQWTKYASQKSVTIALIAGKKYYIEALHKEGAGGDNLAVGWSLPGSTTISVIPGSQLSPFAASQETRGKISFEKWNNISGTSLTSIPLSSVPSQRGEISLFETTSNAGDNYGQRVRGYVHPTTSGSYTFYIASDDSGELWLSTDENPANKRKIAFVSGGWASPRQWTKFSSQKSMSITLTAGKKYYIEALHKEGVGGDNLAIGWTLPGSTAVNVIAGSHLSPFATGTARLASASEEEAGKELIALYPNPFSDRVYLQTETEGEVSITLVDYLGRSLYRVNKSASGRELELDFSGLGLKSGIYLLQVQKSDGAKQVIRVVKQ